jgi:hypothetical protein
MAEPNSPRKRGNPNWGRPMPPARALATAFEMRVSELRLTVESYVLSIELRSWREENRNRCYVPEWLLDEWGFRVDSNLSGSA